MSTTEIGTVSISYDENGIATEAIFKPKEMLITDEEILNNLKGIHNEDQKSLKNDADWILSSWFTQVARAELADPDKYLLTGDVIKCETYPDGKVKKCVIKYSLVEAKYAS